MAGVMRDAVWLVRCEQINKAVQDATAQSEVFIFRVNYLSLEMKSNQFEN